MNHASPEFKLKRSANIEARARLNPQPGQVYHINSPRFVGTDRLEIVRDTPTGLEVAVYQAGSEHPRVRSEWCVDWVYVEQMINAS